MKPETLRAFERFAAETASLPGCKVSVSKWCDRCGRVREFAWKGGAFVCESAATHGDCAGQPNNHDKEQE